MVKIKICGITSLDDALAAVSAGADALGFVFHPASPRNLTAGQAREIIAQLPPFVHTVGLFVNEPVEAVNATADLCGLDLVQLHGDESPEYCASVRRRVIKAVRVKDQSSLEHMEEYDVAAVLLDAWCSSARGGTGITFNWEIASEVAASGRIILAGGLTPENVGEAIRRVRPYAVDVSSGVESAPGIKDHGKMQRFTQGVHAASNLSSVRNVQ